MRRTPLWLLALALLLVLSVVEGLAACAPGATPVLPSTPTPLPTSSTWLRASAVVPEKPTYTVRRGEVVDSLAFTARARPWLAKVEQTWSSLTEREQQVLVKLAEGKTDAKVAETLGLSVKTVGNHAGSIFNKLGVRSRTEAATWAVRAGIGAADRENSL